MGRPGSTPGSAAPPDEALWHAVRAQFPLRDGLILMNAANLCPSPYQVISSVETMTRDIDADASFQNRATASTSWDVKAMRRGFAVVRVATPDAPRDAASLVEPFERAVTTRTRVLAFSHVSNVSGIALPAAALCAMARERGIVTLVDGAQAFGALALDLHELGCDFYTGSAHKWFLGPNEAGVLYVRRGNADRLWASNVGVGWANAVERGAQKFDNLGQRDDACVADAVAALT